MSRYGPRTLRNASVSNDNTNPFGNGFWKIEFTPAVFSVGAGDFEIYHMSVKGPSNSSLQVFINSTFYSTTSRGDLNEWDPSQVLPMIGGQSLIFYWNSAGNPHPVVTVWMRGPRF